MRPAKGSAVVLKTNREQGPVSTIFCVDSSPPATVAKPSRSVGAGRFSTMQLRSEGVGRGLEDEQGAGAGLDNLLRGFLAAAHGPEAVALGGGGQILHHEVEDQVARGIVQGTGAEHGEDPHLTDGLLEAGVDVL